MIQDQRDKIDTDQEKADEKIQKYQDILEEKNEELEQILQDVDKVLLVFISQEELLEITLLNQQIDEFKDDKEKGTLGKGK